MYIFVANIVQIRLNGAKEGTWEDSLADDPYSLSKFMIGLYGDDAERQARAYALSIGARGQQSDAAVWNEAAALIAKRAKIVKTLDS